MANKEQKKLDGATEAVSTQPEVAGETIAADILQVGGGNNIRDIPDETIIATEEVAAPETATPVEDVRPVEPQSETVTVDKKKFAKMVYSLVVGKPEFYLREAGIRRIAELVGITEYNAQVKFWQEMKDYYNANG